MTFEQQIISLREIYRTAIIVEKPNGKVKLLGRIDDVLFGAGDLLAVGFSVKRPRVLGVVRRKPINIAREVLAPAQSDEDALTLVAGGKAGQPPAGAGSDFDWERTVILYGLPVYTTENERLGKVSDALVRTADGSLAGLEVSAGTASDATLGKRTLPAAYVLRFLEAPSEAAPHVLLVDAAAKNCAYAGGLAALAGKASGKMNEAAEKFAVRAGTVAGQAANALTSLADAARPAAAKAGEAVVTTATKAASETQRVAKEALESDVGQAAKKRVQDMWGAFSEGYKSGLHDTESDNK